MPFSPSQAGIVCPILKMDDSLHSKNYERGKFRVAKFLNRTTKLIHQMWDEIKHQNLMFHYINQQCPIFVVPAHPNTIKILFSFY
jgi:hypothetical protein